MISDLTKEFAGKRIVDWNEEDGLDDAAGTLPRISLTYEEHEEKKSWPEQFEVFLAQPYAAEVTGIVVGAWDFFSEVDASTVISALVAARDRLPKLTSLFIGDITYEECEISWIKQSDITPLFEAFPALEHLTVRGSDGLVVEPVRHAHLKSLTYQSGGLPVEIVESVLASELPALEHLELWLGSDEYNGTVTLDSLTPLLEGGLFPALNRLGLCDSEFVDEIAQAIMSAPVLERLQVLDLSLGTLTDEGAAALLASSAIARLKKLDLHYHFCSAEMVEKLEALPIEVDVSDPQTPDEYDGEISRYVAHAE